MSRSNDVSTAMQYAKSGVDGVHLMDSHKATIGWVVNTLAVEVERLEDACSLHESIIEACEAERNAAITCAETAEARVAELEEQIKGAMQAGGYEHFTAQVRNAKEQAHNAIYVAQQLEKKVAELEAQNARLRAALMRVTGSLGLVLKGAGISAPAHRENYDAAKKVIEETFSGDRKEANAK